METLVINNKHIYTPILDIVKDIQRCCNNGKLATIKPRSDNIRVTCPIHKGGKENKASADIYIGPSTDDVKYGHFTCFTCGASHPFYMFVAACFDCSIDSAKDWLIQNYWDGKETIPIDLPEIILNKNIKKTFIDESILTNFESFSPYITLERGLSKSIIEKFEVKYDSKTKCIVFPVRDELGRLQMLTKRSVNSKMFFIDEDKEKPLYLLFDVLKNNINTVMICESQIDALQAYSYGFPCVATIGAISNHQIDLLNKSGIRILYTFFDNDAAGVRFTNKLNSAIRKDILVINIKLNIPGKKDINDLTRDEFYKCIKESKGLL